LGLGLLHAHNGLSLGKCGIWRDDDGGWMGGIAKYNPLHSIT